MSAPRRTAPARTGLAGSGDSSYTLTFSSATWRSLKALAALRGQSIREFFRCLVTDELDRAVASKELSPGQAERPARRESDQ